MRFILKQVSENLLNEKGGTGISNKESSKRHNRIGINN